MPKLFFLKPFSVSVKDPDTFKIGLVSNEEISRGLCPGVTGVLLLPSGER